jgi:neurofibromin 1
MVNTVDAVSQLTRHLGQIIYYLSSSNWTLVFGRVKSRLVHFTTTIEDAPDLIDLRLFQWSNFNRNRLGQVIQEASNLFLHIKRPSQIAFASVLHSAIWNWIDINPLEFEALVESNRRMEGGPDGLFDVLYSMSDFSSSNAKRTAVFYPLLSMLLVISPDLLKKVVLGDASAKSSGMSKKFSFMESLKKGMSGNKGFEPSTRCYLNFVKAAVSLSTKHDTSGLRTLLPEIVNDLKVCLDRLGSTNLQDALFFGPHSNDLADSDLPVEGLVALYRANPNLITSTVFGRLWLDSDISRTIAIKACATICLEQQCSPWYPPIDTLRSEVVSHIRQAFRVSCLPLSELTIRGPSELSPPTKRDPVDLVPASMAPPP